MADNNRNRNLSQYGSDENWDRNRRNEERRNDDYNYNQENQGSFGNTSFGQDSVRQGRGMGQSGGYSGGYSGEYGEASRNRNQDDYRNRQDFSDHGAYSSDYGYQQTGRDQWNEDRDFGNQQQRRQGGQWSGTGNYGGYTGGGREDWGRANVNTFDNYPDDYGRRQQQEGRDDWNRQDYGRQQYSSNYGRQAGYGQASGGYGNRGYEKRSGYEDRRDWRTSADRDYDRDRSWWDRTRDEVSSWFGDEDAERRRRSDDYREGGGHRGKGPKEYQRSADRIREDVCDRLSEDDHIDASNIDVKIEGNDVILAGNVKSRYEKRHAEEIVENIIGVRNVENRIRVAHPDDSPYKRTGDYTGTTDNPGGIGRESGTTNEISRNVNKQKNR